MLKGFHDADRAVLRIAGADARDWLQDLVTNDVRRLSRDAAVYAALLSAQGKYLFDFFLVEAADGAVLIDVAAERAAALAQRLTLYRLRRAVTVGDVSAAVGVALLWGEGAPADAVRDPRDAALGWRCYGDAAAALAGAQPATRAEYDALRVARVVPQSGAELIPDDSYILECGFERLHGVDFRKGCYVGQEVTARMRHKTELRKGLMRVRVTGGVGGDAAPGAPVMTADGKVAGALHTVVGGLGLAHLRHDRLDGPLTAGSAQVTPDQPPSAASTAASPSR